ncbi:MaoC family dehydratase [Massilia sp. GCM10023247]|uniref:MaoC family dehydratase n=1 Tax=Massilia sp. GCM10023247 TaxID=3252643 RepID=UPI00361B3BB1
MKFAEIAAAGHFLLGPVSADSGEVVAFASSFDDQWFHTDAGAAAEGPFGGLIASGWHTCALAMRLVSRELLAGSESFASPGLAYLRWPHPVRPGDQLMLEVTVIEARRSASRPELGIVRWQWVLRNSDNQVVLDLEATSMFALGPPVA